MNFRQRQYARVWRCQLEVLQPGGGRTAAQGIQPGIGQLGGEQSRRDGVQLPAVLHLDCLRGGDLPGGLRLQVRDQPGHARGQGGAGQERGVST